MAQLAELPNSVVVQELQRRLRERLADVKGVRGKILDANALPPAQPPNGQAYDALLLPGTLSRSQQPVQLLQQYLTLLRPDAVVLGYVLGEGSFPEVRHACHTAEFPAPPALPAVQDVGALLQRSQLALPVVDRESLILTFTSLNKLINSLKIHDIFTRPKNTGLLTPSRWQQWQKVYPERPDGSYACTLELIFFHGVTPSMTTPKAAARGSGKISLVKILAPKA